MKNRIKYLLSYLLVISCLLFFSCTKNKNTSGIQKTLDSINNIVEYDKNNAALLMDSISSHIANMNQLDLIRYKLLEIKIRDKNDDKFTIEDSSKIDSIINYLMNNNCFYLGEAYYYAGRVSKELGDSPEALDYFKRALTSINNRNNYLLESKIHSQMSDLYLNQGMFDEGMKEAEKELKFSYLLNNPKLIINNECVLGHFYMKKDSFEQACSRFNHALEVAKRINNIYEESNILHHFLSLYVTQNKMNKADSIWSLIKKMPIDSSQLSPNYSILSNYFIRKKNWDSAIPYLELLCKIGTKEGKKTANRRLSFYYSKTNQHKKADIHMRNAYKLEDSIRDCTNTISMDRINGFYSYNVYKEKNRELKLIIHNKNRLIIVLSISFLLIFILLLLFVFLFMKIKFYDKKISSALQSLFSFIFKYQNIISESNGNIVNKPILTLIPIKTNFQTEEFHNISESISLNDNDNITTDIKDKVCNKIHHNINDETININNLIKNIRRREYNVSPTLWMEIEKEISIIYPVFFRIFLSDFKLTPEEWKVSMLTLLDIRPTDIAEIMNSSRSNISNIRSRLYKKYKHILPPNFLNWDSFIKSFRH